jgi:sugar-phosphatase
MQQLFSRDGIDAVLFDMDGTLLTSVKASERVWTAWARRHGVDVAALMPTIHGVRAVDTIRKLALAGVDAEAEAAAITAAEIADVAGIDAIAGAADFLAALPAERWAVVTSAPAVLARRRIEAAGLPLPAVLVAAEDVTRGKPAPDCFLATAARLRARPERCLVLEDSAVGIAAAEAAGMPVLVVTATHGATMATRHPAIRDYGRLRVRRDAAGGLGIYAVAEA